MRPYFAKYLPVEGEIKKNDYLLDIRMPKLGIVQALTDNEGKKLQDLGCKKHKLFLYSRDEPTEHITDRQTYIPSKPIGEISPAASWVKEGDEFDKEEISLPSTTKRLGPFKWYVLIKGPCGHFH